MLIGTSDRVKVSVLRIIPGCIDGRTYRSYKINTTADVQHAKTTVAGRIVCKCKTRTERNDKGIRAEETAGLRGVICLNA